MLFRSSVYGQSWMNFAGVDTDDDGHYIATGGRVLSATAMDTDLSSAQRLAYELMAQLSLEGGHFRTDIAHRAMH